jgi:mono/diheme cytochrome c family protein
MLKSPFFVLFAATIAAGVIYADQSKSNITIQAKNTPPTNGKQMYATYCAPCHGVDGKGNGPVAPALKTMPANLTVLSRDNGGVSPSEHVIGVLEHGVGIPAHGTAQMPVWGPTLGKIDQGYHLTTPLRINNLSKYLETLQVK